MSWQRKPDFIKRRECAKNEQRSSLDRAEYVAALNSAKQAYVDAHKNDRSRETWKAIRECLTIALLLLTALFTGLTYKVFYDTMVDARLSARDAHNATINMESLTADALGQAQAAANMAHIDNATSGRTSQSALEAANRAWIAPRSVVFAEPFKIGGAIKLRIFYENNGHQIAQDIGAKFTTDRIKNYHSDGSLISQANAIGPNNTCGIAKPLRGADAVYPSSQFAPAYQWDFDPSDFVGDTAIQNLTDTLVAKGCSKYRTLNTVHRSAFCFVLRTPKGKALADASWAICPIGNFAD